MQDKKKGSHVVAMDDENKEKDRCTKEAPRWVFEMHHNGIA